MASTHRSYIIRIMREDSGDSEELEDDSLQTIISDTEEDLSRILPEGYYAKIEDA